MEYLDLAESDLHSGVCTAQNLLKGRSARGIAAQLLSETYKNLSKNTEMDIKGFLRKSAAITGVHDSIQHRIDMTSREFKINEQDKFLKPLDELRWELKGFDTKTTNYFLDKR